MTPYGHLHRHNGSSFTREVCRIALCLDEILRWNLQPTLKRSTSTISYTRTAPPIGILQNGNKPSGNVSADPQFVNYTGDSTGDYHLQSTSPALEKGTDRGTPTIGFGAREKNSKRNLGAYRGTRLPSE
jgi:hypothetical protein